MADISLPKGANSETIQLVPAKISLQTTYDTTVSTSTQVTFDTSTRLIEVTALTQPILMKWGTTAVTTSNFDNVIAAGTTRHFTVPVNQSAAVPRTLYTAANFIEQAASATLCVTEF